MINSKADLNKYLEMDKKALQRKENKPRLFGDDIWKYEIALRKHEYYVNTKPSIIKKVLRKYWAYRHYKLGQKLNIQISVNSFGGGVCIMHSGSIVVHPEAKIGNWCCIFQGVTIGQHMLPHSVPKIGDNVMINPGAKIFGDIEIGNDVMIGANAVVNKSFPEGHCRIAGVPARIISNKGNFWIDGVNRWQELS